ncbi:MAG TPA: 16S rRNA (cytosine(1402)-N(4))-methyltransferase RsmH [Bacilli bacterium]|nr:16S rRNA (cytosine(1402)-N(4))-methyltransferase RsmH [Bacilli bacterium]
MHKSVLLKESIDSLNIKEDGIYVDCTLGYAGHSKAILQKIKKGKLYAFDQDKEAREASDKVLSEVSNNYEIIPSNFLYLKEELEKRNITKVDGILFDLGVSSPQLDDEKRGFSYHTSARLDMRMNLESDLDAYYVVNNYPYEKLVKILFMYGEEKYAKQIAKNIDKARLVKKVETTLELADIISASVPEKYKRLHHPARKTFQAIRIEVNNELEVFAKALEDAISILNKGGRLAVITFHSLEDRICKNIFNKYSEEDKITKGMPNTVSKAEIKVFKKIKPSIKEINENNRSRSAILRVVEKI